MKLTDSAIDALLTPEMVVLIEHYLPNHASSTERLKMSYVRDIYRDFRGSAYDLPHLTEVEALKQYLHWRFLY